MSDIKDQIESVIEKVEELQTEIKGVDDVGIEMAEVLDDLDIFLTEILLRFEEFHDA